MEAEVPKWKEDERILRGLNNIQGKANKTKKYLEGEETLKSMHSQSLANLNSVRNKLYH